ncbi:helix-turn-helix transcriptional regulator [Chitinimonas sp. BJYL2]|uniref:helix-turn-helix domain-containing protein n=1 Tax=Chitinimonas sp. BJYL2 TaxID=2976696 RepID=UPI0022B4E004|nr:helix-turn-helix transcriptional regulator [Chitinimonas sp. BJYL2]
MSPLRTRREALCMSLYDLSEKVDASVPHLSNIETDKVRCSPALAERIAKVLEISELEILYPDRYTQPAANAPMNVSSSTAYPCSQAVAHRARAQAPGE